jgi:ankyrin repeat protein
MQDSFTPAIVACRNGHTETLALLLLNKADVNSADKVNGLNYSVAYNTFTMSFKIRIFLVSNYQRF